jgi:hypothetical protein
VQPSPVNPSTPRDKSNKARGSARGAPPVHRPSIRAGGSTVLVANVCPAPTFLMPSVLRDRERIKAECVPFERNDGRYQ